MSEAGSELILPFFSLSFVFCYISIVSGASKIDVRWFPFIELGWVISLNNVQPPKQPSAEQL